MECMSAIDLFILPIQLSRPFLKSLLELARRKIDRHRVKQFLLAVVLIHLKEFTLEFFRRNLHSQLSITSQSFFVAMIIFQLSSGGP